MQLDVAFTIPGAVVDVDDAVGEIGEIGVGEEGFALGVDAAQRQVVLEGGIRAAEGDLQRAVAVERKVGDAPPGVCAGEKTVQRIALPFAVEERLKVGVSSAAAAKERLLPSAAGRAR